MYQFFFVVLVTIFVVSHVNGANILAVVTLASPSHYLWHRPYFFELAKRGHNVTALLHQDETKKVSNYTVIVMEDVYEKLYRHEEYVLENLVHENPLNGIRLMWSFEKDTCLYDLESKGLQTLLNYPKDFKFDLIIWDINSGRCLYPLIDRFGSPPVVATSPFGLHSHLGYVFGYQIPSYVPFYQLKDVDRGMSFRNRIINFFYIHAMNLSKRFYSVPLEFEIAKRHFGDNIRDFDEIEREMHILLANIDHVLHYAENLPPNIIPVAGLPIEKPKPLPKDLETIMDNAQHGVILAVLGTNLRWDQIDKEKREAFLEAFEKLPQTILLKTPTTTVDFPKNVIAREWLPQNDILAHPNLKLFITHGGALSTHEAMYHGVPTVGLPFYLDQHGIMAKIDARSLGKQLDFFQLHPDTVYNAIKEVLYNSTYRENVQTVSKRYRDQPQTPMEKALFWTEYVLRHNGAEHLSPASRYMPIYQRFDLDMLAIFLALPLVLLWVTYKVIKRACCARQKETKKLKKN